MANRSAAIAPAARLLCGTGVRPMAILLTHVHPDHAGSARELAEAWACPVYMHSNGLALAVARDLSTSTRFANPLDRWVILPPPRAMPRRRIEAMLARQSLAEVVRALARAVRWQSSAARVAQGTRVSVTPPS